MTDPRVYGPVLEGMEERWQAMMAEKHPTLRPNERRAEWDQTHARACIAYRMEIEKVKEEHATTQFSPAKFSPQQIEQLKWLDRCQGALGKDGKRLTDSHELYEGRTPLGQLLRKNLSDMRALIYKGGVLPQDFIDQTMVRLASVGGTIPNEVHRNPSLAEIKHVYGEHATMPALPMPPSHHSVAALPQLTLTRVPGA